MEQKIIDTINQIIRELCVVLGPSVTFTKAREIEGLVISPQGEVEQIAGDHLGVLKQLINSYVALNGAVIKKVTDPILQKHLNTSLI